MAQVMMKGLNKKYDDTSDAVVDVVEPLGSEILLDVHTGQSAMVARVEPSVRGKAHETLKLALTPDRARFFDPKTELAI